MCADLNYRYRYSEQSVCDGGRFIVRAPILNMRTARAYFLDGAYDQAEAALDELIPSIDSVPGDQVGLLSLTFFGLIE